MPAAPVGTNGWVAHGNPAVVLAAVALDTKRGKGEGEEIIGLLLFLNFSLLFSLMHLVSAVSFRPTLSTLSRPPSRG